MGIYSVDKIKNWYDDFASEYNVYNKYYSDFKNSYINICHATTIANMNKKLDEHYSRIKRINSRVDKLWKKYIEDLEAVDKKLAGQKASFNDSTLAAKASKLPELKEYKVTFSTKINSLSTSAGIIKSIGWSEEKTSSENLKNSLESLLASGAVVVTSVVSGMGKLAEEFKDGLLWLDTAVISGTATLFGAKEWANNFQNKMMKVINFDAVGKANEVFYEKTEIGRRINEKSLLKYDSKAAQGIQSVSTKATEIALATALTVATAGASAPVSALIVGSEGFLIGAGEKAQESFKNNDGNFWESSKEIVVAGGAKAIEFYSEGQMGAGAINAVGTVKSAGGIKNIVSSMKPVLFNGESSLFTKESLKNGLKTTFKDVDTYMDSLGAAFDNIKYDNKNGIQIDWSGLAKETACNLAMNSTFGFLSNGFETRRISGMKNLELNANKSDVNIDSLKKEYDELIGWRNSDKFLTDEAYYKTYGDKIGGNSYKKNIERISELENALEIKNTGIPESKIYDYSTAKKEADELARKISKEPITGFENMDTLPKIDKDNHDLSLNKMYSESLGIFSKQGTSYEQYAAKNGIKIKNHANEMDLAVDIGDENWYLVQVLKNNEKGMSPNQLQIAQAACNKPRLDLDTDELLNAAGPFLTEKDIANLNEIGKHPNMKNLTLQEKHTLFQFQNAGGSEINGIIREKDYSSFGIESLYDLENIMQSENGPYGAAGIKNHGHLRTIDKNNTIIEQIDNIIKNNANTSTIKSVSYLNSVGPNVPTGQVLDTIERFGPNSPEALQAVQDLIGLDMTDSAFNSKTIPPTRKTNYSNRFNNLKMGDANSLDIKVESYISPGCGAYIDTCGGVNNGLGEMLIKRNCPQKIIDAYMDPIAGKLVLVTLYT